MRDIDLSTIDDIKRDGLLLKLAVKKINGCWAYVAHLVDQKGRPMFTPYRTIGRVLVKDYKRKARNAKVTTNPSTFVKVANVNLARKHFSISNTHNAKGVFINLCSVSEAEKGTGRFLERRNTWPMPTDAIYTGEICVIAEADEPELTILEY